MDNDERIPVSYIAQYGYCPRRCGLLMLEQCWNENEYTASGRAEHTRVHTSRIEKRGKNIKIYEFAIASEKLNLFGKCDCLELTESEAGAKFDFSESKFDIFPVEYKHGVVRNELEYNMQLCAQAICLEEMYQTNITKGAIFYIDSHRRVEIELTQQLRDSVIRTAKEISQIQIQKTIPHAQYTKKCNKCSLYDICMPKLNNSAKEYIKQLRNFAEED